MRDLGRLLILAGACLVVVGVILTFVRKGLPGDFVVRRGNFTFYFPLMTSIVLSVVLTFLFWLFGRR